MNKCFFCSNDLDAHDQCSSCAEENGLFSVRMVGGYEGSDIIWHQFHVLEEKEIGFWKDNEGSHIYLNLGGKIDEFSCEPFDLNPSNAKDHFERCLKLMAFQ